MNKGFGGNDENFIKASDIKPEEPHKSEQIPVYQGEQRIEVLSKTEGKCQKSPSCPYNGKIIERAVIQATDEKGNKKRWEQMQYFCAFCLDNFEHYKDKPKARTIAQVESDVKSAMQRFRKLPELDNKTRVLYGQ